MERKDETMIMTPASPPAGIARADLTGERGAVGPTSGSGVMETIKVKGQEAIDTIKEMTGMDKQGTATTTARESTHGNITTGEQRQLPEFVEATKEGMDDMLERAKDKFGLGEPTTGQKIEGAFEGAKAGYQSGEKPYVQKSMAAVVKEGVENAADKAKHMGTD